MKKWLIGFGVFLGLIIGSALVIPLFVKVDQYRPQILKIVNQRLNGELSLGELKLSLWGKVRVDIAGLDLKDAAGQSVLSVKDAYLHIPFLPLFKGKPELDFVMNQPQVVVLKDKKGQLNVMGLMKKSSESPEPSAKSQKQETLSVAGDSSMQMKELPSWVASARLGVQLSHADLNYQDLLSGVKSQIQDLNFEIRDLSLTHPAEFKLWTKLHAQIGKTLSLASDFKLNGRLEPKLDAAQHSIQALSSTVRAEFLNAQMDLQVLLSELQDVNQMQFHFSLKSNEILLKPWTDLLPELKPYELGGSFQMSAQAQGQMSHPTYEAQLSFKDLSFKLPQLLAPGVLAGQIKIKTDQVESMLLSLKAPGNELNVQGQLLSFSKPKLNLTVSSPGMDLDQWVKFEKKTKTAQAAPSTGSDSSSAEGTQSGSGVDYDAMLQPLRDLPIAQNFLAQVRVQMSNLKAQQVPIQEIECHLSLKDLALGLDQCRMKVFSGEIQSQGAIQFKPQRPTYQMQLKVSHLDFGQAVQTQMPLFKNTVKGLGSFKMDLQGKSLNPALLMDQLSAQGNLRVEQATFTTIDVMKMVKEGLGQALSRVGDKIPALKGKKLDTLPDREAQYEFMGGEFTLAQGVFQSPKFQAKAVPQKGLDLNGRTQVKLKDLSVDAFWEVVDTYNITHVRDLSIEQLGVKVDHLFAEGNAPVSFPIHVGCTLKAPCYSYTEIPEHLAKIALKNSSKAASQRVSQEAKKKAEDLIKQVAPPAIQEKLKRFFR